jgi:hypothetical protein
VPQDKYSSAGTQHITEGRYEEVLHQRAIHSHGQRAVSTFVKMVVLDVISDPTTVDKTKLDHYEHDLGVSNPAYASVAPRNSIIARPVMGANSGASDKVMVLYPFFPPHISFPAKPGEHVWAIFESPDAKVHELGYWMCRVVGPSFVEDVNYTHMDRQFDKSFLPGLSSIFEGSDDPMYEFRNGAVDEDKDSKRFTIPETSSLPGDEDAYKKLLTTSDASKIIKYEPVPRYRKRPADTVFEGSNNTLIVLGTDRTGGVSDYDPDPVNGKVPKPNADDVADVGAGAIDMVVGRGQTPDTAGKPEDNKVLGKELGKSKKDLADKEGDVDFKNDRSRILIAQKTKPDKNFKIDAVVKAHTKALVPPAIEDGDGEGAVIIKTDKVRLIARHDVVILVSGATAKDDNGNVKDPDIDPLKCASIILKANGDIIFTPSDTGLIRLGGPDAGLAPLCTSVGRAPGMPGVPGTGLPPAAPIVSSMGGAIGSKESFGPLNGTYATRVLMK